MMKREMTYRYIARLLLIVLLLPACSSDEDDGKDTTCYLDIYVYSPAHPMVTRADAGYVNASTEENKVHSLQIWLFKHSDGELLGYVSDAPGDLPETGKTYRIAVTPTIAEGSSSERRVDVYVLANVEASTCGLSFDESTTRAELDAAKIVDPYFGVISPLSSVSNGLPMSGVLKNEPVVGSFPVLRIGTENQISTVKLARTVSKLRFVLCRIHEDDKPANQLHSITSITLDGNQIPQEEYLMLNTAFDGSLNPSEPLADSRMHITPNSYIASAISFTPPATSAIPIVENPLDYIYDNQKFASVQAYENALNDFVASGQLAEAGLTYLRESDKKLKGTISYRVESDPETASDRTTVFEMSRAGDFTRDHSWIIYVFFSGGKLQVFDVVQVGIKKWVPTGDPEGHEFYNW